MNNNSWKAIFDKYKIHKHNFDKSPFIILPNKLKTQHHISKKPMKEKFVFSANKIHEKIDHKFSLTTTFSFYLSEMENMLLLKVKDILIFQK